MHIAMSLAGAVSVLLFVTSADAKVTKYTLTLSNGIISPDGNQRNSWLVNGQTPGPHLTFDEGDEAHIRVINKGRKPTSMHWHGIQQNGTMWADGVPGLTQYPIKPGQDLLYKFNMTQHGFHWYHSHYKMQTDDGLKGTLFIRPKKYRPNPFSLITGNKTTLSRLEKAANNALIFNVYDYKHYTSDYSWAEWKRTGIEQLCVDSILINGKGQVVCPSKEIIESLALDIQKPLTPKGCLSPNNSAIFPFPDSKPELADPKIYTECKNTTTPLQHWEVNQNDEWVAFNVLNSGALWDVRVSIDSHTLYVYAADGDYVRIRKVTSLTILPGERYSFFVKLDQKPDVYTVRAAAAVIPQIQSGFGVLSYAKKGSTTSSGAPIRTTPTPKKPYIDFVGNPINNGTDLTTYLLAPYPANPPPRGPADQTIRLEVSRPEEYKWTMNGIPFHDHRDTATPLLFHPENMARQNNRTHFSIAHGSLVDVIMVVTGGNPALHPPHPMHKHGVKSWSLGSGEGDFPYSTVYEAIQANYSAINTINPPFRDNIVTPPVLIGKGWAAFRYVSENIGPVFLHCHLDPHLAAGMAVVFFEGASPSTIANPMSLTSEYQLEKVENGYVPKYYLEQNKPDASEY